MARARSRRFAARRSTRTWQVAALVAAAALAAAGCSSSSSSSGTSASSSSSTPASGTSTAPGNATSGTVNWWASPINTSGKDVRQVLISDFEKAYPGIKVTLTSAPTNTDTNRATLATDISGGSATPDVFMGDVIWPAQFGAHQLAVPLSDYLPSSYFAQFAPGLVQGATYNGKVYGSPMFEDNGFLYYRKDLLTKENLPVPTTWEQLLSESETLQKAGLVKYGYVFQGASYEGLTCNYMEFLTSAGGMATNADYSTATLDSAASIKAVTFMRSLVTSGVSPASVTTFQEAQAMSTFAAGKRRVPAELGLRLRRLPGPGHPDRRQGRRGAAADVPGHARPRVLQHRRLELVHQPAQQEHRGGPDLHQVAGLHPGPDGPRHGVLVDPDRGVGADLPRGPRQEPGAGHRGEGQAGPAARGHAQLPAAEHRDLHQRELGAGRLDLTVGGHVGGPISRQHGPRPAPPAACNRIADAQGQQVAPHACWPWAAFRVTNITWAGRGELPPGTKG